MSREQVFTALGVSAAAAAAGGALLIERSQPLDHVLSLRFARDLKAPAIRGFLAALATAKGNWRVAFEVHGANGRLTHRLRVSDGRAAAVVAQLRAHVPGTRVEVLDELNPAGYGFTAAQEFSLVGESGPLADSDPPAVSTALLAALGLTRRGERLVLQWVLTPYRGASLSANVRTDLRRALSPRLPLPDLKASLAKANEIGVEVALRLGAKADTPERAWALIRHVTAPLGIVRTPATAFQESGRSPGTSQRLYGARPAGLVGGGRLTVSELVGLLAWPLGEPHIPGLQQGTSRQLPPSSDISSEGVLIGVSTMPGSTRRLCLTRTGLRQHVGITAPTGTGKSTLLGGIALEAITRGMGVVVVDWKGDLVADLIDRVPSERTADIIVLDPSDPHSVVGLPNALAGDTAERELLVDGLVGWLSRSWDSSWGPRTGSVVQASLFTLARAGGYALVDLPELLTNPALRQRVLAAVADITGLDGFWAHFEAMSEAERAQVIAPTLNRTRPWLLRRDIRHVLGQPESRFTLDEVLAGKVLLVNLSAGRLGEETARLLGSLLVGQLSAAIARRSRIPESKRHTALVVLDEFQYMAGLAGDFEQTLALARGLGIGFVVAHQHMGQLDTGLREAVLANVRSRVAFQLSARDAEVIAREFGPLVKAADLQQLAAFEAIARLATKHGVSPPASLRTEPWPPTLRSRAAVLKSSRQRYGRRREDIEALIAARHTRGTTAGPIGRKPGSRGES